MSAELDLRTFSQPVTACVVVGMLEKAGWDRSTWQTRSTSHPACTCRDNPRARRFYERNGWSCGVGAALVEAEWPGPVMDGMSELGRPLPEVEYRRASRTAPGR